MAKASAKRISSQNASTLQTLLAGFLISGLIHIGIRLVLYRTTARTKDYVYFLGTEALAVGLWTQLRSMASSGEDLAQAGLTAYFFDIIYVTWFVHVATAVVSSKFWWIYLVIPAYIIHFAYRKAIVPFLLGGRDPLAGIFSIFSGRGGGGASNAADATSEDAPATSKRQQKLQKRQEKGDPRVQVRRR